MKFLQKLIRTPMGQALIARMGALFIWILYHTNRWTYENRQVFEEYVRTGRPAIICFWHGHMALLPRAWQWSKPFYMLLSHHTDGKLIGRIISHFGIRAVYGSTQRRGEQAGRRILEILAQGHYVGITPDGPRGPGYQVSPGIIRLAQFAGVDIIPLTYITTRGFSLKSWDRFWVPLPFGRGKFVCGNPVRVTHDIEETRTVLALALQKITAPRADT